MDVQGFFFAPGVDPEGILGNHGGDMLKVRDLSKVFEQGGRQLEVLKSVSFDVADGERCALVGPSGSGKTTLLGLCAGLDTSTAGTVQLGGALLHELDEDARARLRNEVAGFVFQSFQLLPSLTAIENVTAPAELIGRSGAEARAKELLEEVGLKDRMTHYPTQLSGGEQQRVALARAFVNEPRILFADEPTGNLDSETSTKVEELFFDLNQRRGTTLVMVTHDMDLARKVGRVIHMKGGEIIEDSARESAVVAD